MAVDVERFNMAVIRDGRFAMDTDRCVTIGVPTMSDLAAKQDQTEKLLPFSHTIHVRNIYCAH